MVRAVVVVWCRVEHQVVGDVAVHFTQGLQGVADGDTHAPEGGVVGVREVQVVLAGDDQQLVRRAGPVGADGDHLVVGGDDALARIHLGLDSGAEDAAALEAAERPLLVEDLARHERQAEQLAVRVGQAGAGLTAVVDDGLGVAHVAAGGVLLQAALEEEHHVAGVFVRAFVGATVVVRGVDEHLVDATGLGLHVHRALVVHSERFVAVERRVQVGDDPHAPVAALVERFQGRQGGFLVAGAERARAVGLGLHLFQARREVRRALGPVGHNRDPPPGKGVETELTHSVDSLRGRRPCKRVRAREIVHVARGRAAAHADLLNQWSVMLTRDQVSPMVPFSAHTVDLFVVIAERVGGLDDGFNLLGAIGQWEEDTADFRYWRELTEVYSGPLLTDANVCLINWESCQDTYNRQLEAGGFSVSGLALMGMYIALLKDALASDDIYECGPALCASDGGLLEAYVVVTNRAVSLGFVSLSFEPESEGGWGAVSKALLDLGAFAAVLTCGVTFGAGCGAAVALGSASVTWDVATWTADCVVKDDCFGGAFADVLMDAVFWSAGKWIGSAGGALAGSESAVRAAVQDSVAAFGTAFSAAGSLTAATQTVEVEGGVLTLGTRGSVSVGI